PFASVLKIRCLPNHTGRRCPTGRCVQRDRSEGSAPERRTRVTTAHSARPASAPRAAMIPPSRARGGCPPRGAGSVPPPREGYPDAAGDTSGTPARLGASETVGLALGRGLAERVGVAVAQPGYGAEPSTMDTPATETWRCA